MAGSRGTGKAFRRSGGRTLLEPRLSILEVFPAVVHYSNVPCGPDLVKSRQKRQARSHDQTLMWPGSLHLPNAGRAGLLSRTSWPPTAIDALRLK